MQANLLNERLVYVAMGWEKFHDSSAKSLQTLLGISVLPWCKLVVEFSDRLSMVNAPHKMLETSKLMHVTLAVIVAVL
jgi:hypothetical protein